MKDVKMYREYAADCIRIAQSMNAEDREIYSRWRRRGKIGAESERREKRKANGKSSQCPSDTCRR